MPVTGVQTCALPISVGRLDRHTTGVLLFTNDGDLAKKLTHPSYDHKKIYQVFLNKPLEEPDFKAIAEGIELEDGFIKADEIEYTSPDNKSVGIEVNLFIPKIAV